MDGNAEKNTAKNARRSYEDVRITQQEGLIGNGRELGQNRESEFNDKGK